MNPDPLRRGVIVVILALAVGMSWARVSDAAPSGRLEIFSWWTAGGEAQALKALFDIYHKRYPTVEIVNAAIAGGGWERRQNRAQWPDDQKQSTGLVSGARRA